MSLGTYRLAVNPHVSVGTGTVGRDAASQKHRCITWFVVELDAS